MGRFTVGDPPAPAGRFSAGRFYVAPEDEAWQATASPNLQRRKLPDGRWEYRPTPQAGREPAISPAEAPGVGERLGAFADRAITAAGEGIVAVPELVAGAARYLGGGPSGTAMVPEQDAPESPFPTEAYPQLGKPGGFFDLKAGREDIHRQYEQAKDKLRGLPFDSPYDAAAVDTLAEAAGLAVPMGEGAQGVRAAERAAGAGAEDLLRLTRRAPAAASEYTAEELADLAARKRGLARLRPKDIERSMPPAPEPGRLGAGIPDAEIEQALGMRAAPEDAEEVARLSLPIGEPPSRIAPSSEARFLQNPTAERPSLDAIFGPPREPAAARSIPEGVVPGRERRLYRGQTVPWNPEGPMSDLVYFWHSAADEDAAFEAAHGFQWRSPEGVTIRARPGELKIVSAKAHPDFVKGAIDEGNGAGAAESLRDLGADAFVIRERGRPVLAVRRDALHKLRDVEQLANDADIDDWNPLKLFGDEPASPLPRVEIGAPAGAGEVRLPGLTTGASHAITRAERAAAGLPEVERLASSGSDTWTEAKAIYESKPDEARTLAKHIADTPRRVPSDLESDLLVHDRMGLTLDHREALAAESDALARGDKEAAALASLRRRSIEEAKHINSVALDRGGSASGRALQARQKLIAEDYSPLHLTERYRVANGGKALEDADPVRRRLTEISAKLEEAQTRAAAAEERAQQLEAARVVTYEQRKAAQATRGGRRAVSRESLDAENQALTKAFAARAGTPRAGLDPELAAIMAKQARNRIRAGTINLQDLVDELYTWAKPYLADLEPRDVRDVIAGSGPRAQKAAQEAAEKDLPRLRREAHVENALADVRARLAEPGLAPDIRRKLEAEAERWESASAKLGPGRGPASDAERLAASKKRAGAAVADLERQLAAGEFPVKGRAPIAADAELIGARADVERLRREADSIIAHREAANRSGFEKGMDWTAGWGRFIKLSGVATVQKLAAAASTRALVFRPIEEFIGAGLSKLPVVRHFAAEAPVGGGGSLSAVAKSYGAFFGRQAREESAALLRGREGALDLAFGKTHDNPGVPRWMEIPGKVHGALKAPAKVSGYQFAMEKQAQKLLAEGRSEDLLNPLVQAEMKARAWEYAQREIFMGDNAFVNAFNQGLRDVPGQTKVTKAVKTGGRVLLPIVKVPTNYALELTDYAVGLPKAAARMGNVLWEGKGALEAGAARDLGSLVRAGLQEVGPEEAELIMRQLKKGSLGAGMIALGATGIVEAGGYYEPGEHRRHGELQPGEVRIAGMAVPHMLLHHPAIEALQVGAAVHREKKIQDGLVNAFWGVAEQVPFFEEPLRASRTLRSDPSQFFGSIERGMTIQPDIQRLARVLDQRGEHDLAEQILQEAGWKHIEARKRKARGGFFEQLGEEELLGIPGLRQNVR